VTRSEEIAQFLAAHGLEGACVSFLAGDASPRRYSRIAGQPSLVLMDAPHATKAEDMGANSYSGRARLAGLHPGAFMGLADALVMRGFSAPRIQAADPDRGLVLMEDLGDQLFTAELGAHPEAALALYRAAVDMLAGVARSVFPDRVGPPAWQWSIQRYDIQALTTEASLFTDWYLPSRGKAIDARARDEWLEGLAEHFQSVAGTPTTLVLRDVHADNLLWLPGRDGHAKVGILDFQDALFGHCAYDLMSLMTDARRDIDEGLEIAMIARFAEAIGITDMAAFKRDYLTLGVQRGLKILGVFERLAKRDGKPHYRAHLPRVERLIRRQLSDAAIAGLAGHIGRIAPELCR
jgi:N-acetylmuramate 1-kinase